MNLPKLVLNALDKPNMVCWLASVNDDNICDINRISAVQWDPSSEELIAFVPEPYFGGFEQNFRARPKVAVTIASLIDFESYQIKGEYTSHGSATEDQTAYFREVLDHVSETVSGFGLDGRMSYGYMRDQKNIALRIKVSDCFEQTPKPKTGGRISDGTQNS